MEPLFAEPICSKLPPQRLKWKRQGMSMRFIQNKMCLQMNGTVFPNGAVDVSVRHCHAMCTLYRSIYFYS